MIRYKIRTKHRPQVVGYKLKRTGAKFYELVFWNGHHYEYREFDDRPTARKFGEALN